MPIKKAYLQLAVLLLILTLVQHTTHSEPNASPSSFLQNLNVTRMKPTMKPRYVSSDNIFNGTNTIRKTISYKNRKSNYGRSMYALYTTKWPTSKYHLTYQILSKTLVPAAKDMKSIVADALGKWGKHSPFTFQEVSENSHSDLVFGFFKGDHGDGHPFDGPGKVLAHSSFPPEGISHYDADEDWSTDPKFYQIDLSSVVLHETGHLLGLADCQVKGAVMYQSLYQGERRRELQPDDIQGIQALYSSPGLKV